MGKKEAKDLFGAVQATPRGWTELDGLRRQYSSVERRVMNGEYDEKDLQKLKDLSQEIIKREQEARGKWTQSFGG